LDKRNAEMPAMAIIQKVLRHPKEKKPPPSVKRNDVRLSKGAGTHLASWLQPSQELSEIEAQQLLDENVSSAKNTTRGLAAWAKLQMIHGKSCGHAKKISDVAYSGAIIITKDASGMRLFRASGDFALLRCLAASGNHVSVHSSGQFIVTGTRNVATEMAISKGGPKVWGPQGGSAFTAGKKSITTKVPQGG